MPLTSIAACLVTFRVLAWLCVCPVPCVPSLPVCCLLVRHDGLLGNQSGASCRLAYSQIFLLDASYTVSCRLAISVGILRHAAIMALSCSMLQAFASCLLSVLSASSSCLLYLPLAFCLLCVLLVCKPSAACLPCVAYRLACPMSCLPSRIASWCLGSGQYAACLSQRVAACLRRVSAVGGSYRYRAVALLACLSCSACSACGASAYHYMTQRVETICKGNASVFGDVANATMAMYEPPRPLPRGTGALPSLGMSFLRNIGGNRKWQ